ncbi:oxidative stress survival, Svf1-like protein [Aspergillus granulosus]|uniref:Oxidative stress survival, Svf1-like protein n=1 Tax=Aspergillus granulosus TaxID=176169 RepID=A0ABR4H934_9EURO
MKKHLPSRGLSYTVSTAEPEYGLEAIHRIAAQAESDSVLTKDGLKWKAMQSTNVETQIFYSSHLRVRWPRSSGLMVTCQLNVKIWNHNSKEHLWNSDPLEHHCFTEDMNTIFGDNFSIALDADRDAYEFKSARNEAALIDLVVKRIAPERDNLWDEIRYRFWARAAVTGTIRTPEKEYNFGSGESPGRAVFSHAIQGMKSHHAAVWWNFATFQTQSYSAIKMEFTTPPSYASTKVNIGGIVNDTEILYAGGDNEVTATLKGPLGERRDRVDALHHIPGIIESLAGGVVGTKPYIYQFADAPKYSLTVEEKGTFFAEATFIS